MMNLARQPCSFSSRTTWMPSFCGISRSTRTRSGQDLSQIRRFPAAVTAHDAQFVSLHNVLQDPDHGGVVLYNIDPHTAPFSMAVLGMVTRKQAPVASVPPGTVPGPLFT